MKRKAMPLVMDYMTAVPQTIGKDLPVKKAEEMMREFLLGETLETEYV